ncbi:aldehyde dehydrogenase (NADP(+)) [Microbacterium murale]|uniref:NADP-dependent aldehyde dehydrogenase n=1 Tax=Microbacterium murale TaxID=1081040 RepID=A0ABU0PCV5_9MICO|nr:aldehyde dehydrogenase (NADP(+)) [Microbacterium murale]MDQ0644752.1 NADP-dependent aldehyde dehydrogenase [Microbacterium murale]
MNESIPREVDDIVRSAAAASALLARTEDITRAMWLRAIAGSLDARSGELVRIADEETALRIPRLTGELARTTAQLRQFADVIEEGSYLEATIDHPNPAATPPVPDLRRVLRPIGPVAVFAASNFPFAFSIAGGDTASALAVGCPVVVKAHPGHPRTSDVTAQIVTESLRESGAPEGTFAMVSGFDAGLSLVDHAGIRAVAFTGSVRGGRALIDRIAARPEPIPFYGELGSLNPVVVTAAADAEQGADLAAGLAASFQLGVGQFCTKPGVVLVPHDSALERELPRHLAAQQRMLTSGIADGFTTGSERVRGVSGVEMMSSATSGDSDGTSSMVAMTDVATLRVNTDSLLEEVFGPFTLLVRYRDEAELDVALSLLPGSLTATLHSSPGEDVAALVHRLEPLAGRLLFGGWPTGVAVSWAQQHGGPWPSTNTQFTSVGATAVRRFQRPVAFQDAPDAVLPAALREENPLRIPRRVDGVPITP